MRGPGQDAWSAREALEREKSVGWFYWRDAAAIGQSGHRWPHPDRVCPACVLSQQAPDEEAKGREPAQLTAGPGLNQLQTRRPAPEQLQVTPGD